MDEQAGDPVEAQAIADAFFPTDREETGSASTKTSAKLFVGSIKTVVGHLEGCAGLAGVLKAVLAIKNRTIPPNMHFKELNPAIEPLYHHLEIPIKAIPWPKVGSGPLRVSVNSFGFGGTNSHAILESYDGDESTSPKEDKALSEEEPFIGPLILSANSDSSLVQAVKSYAEAIKSRPSLNLEDLAWTLQFRRSMLPVKAFFSGATRQRLIDFMDRFVTDAASSPDATAGVRTQLVNSGETPGILGVFTGQGAQWASMGRGLILASPIFRASIERCEAALCKLPDGPSWSLKEEIMADAVTSRISEAELSQPLCTALQIALVDLLRVAGIKLDAVVGHSSGEIAAVYAAGIIDAEAAMQIAYYRGYHAKLAKGTQGQQGRMMAVGLSYDDAQEFCSRSEFAGRVVVAASNSPLSVTLSGDIGAIEQAKDHFDSQKTFARLLKTDTAYHSQHMLPCAEPYLRSLKACDIRINHPRNDCIWISSVRGDVDLLDGDLSCLSGQYWVDNMCNPVLFSQAIEASIWNGGPFDVALEIGPHPALKGPSEQTFKASFGIAPGYAGTMRRGDPEVEAFSGALGYLWSRLGPGSVDFDGYRKSFQGSNFRKPRLLKDLPSYSWDHRRVHWKESRISRNYRLRQDRAQELLGRRVPDDLEDNMRWRNILRLSEIPWLRGHVFQGQVLFPGAGYVAMALEVAKAIAGEREVSVFELEDIVLSRAMVISDRPDGIETVVTARIVNQNLMKGNYVEQMEVEFTCYFCSDESSEMSKACTGRIVIHYGSMSLDALPSRLPRRPDLVPVDMARFYSAMNHVGLEYDGIFHGMLEGDRAMGSASVTASWSASSMSDEYILHPGFLDVAFQSLYVAFSSPASGDIWAPYLPVRIRRLSVNPNVGYLTAGGEIEMEADALVAVGTSTLLEGDIHLYDPRSNSTGLQVEGIVMQAMSEPSSDNDKCIFSETVWEMDISCGLAALDAVRAGMTDDLLLVEVLDRTSLYYWQKLLRDIHPDEIEELKWYHQRMLDAIKYQLTSVSNGQHPVAKREWLDDSYEDIIGINKPYESRVDLRLIHAVGKNLVSVVRGQTQLLEVMLEDDMLNRFYMEGYGFSIVNDAIAATVKQIIHKYPQANILEIGAGTGGTTKSILDKIGSRFSSYTYTDISPAFFKNAADKFRDYENKMNFIVLDVEKDVLSQGFSENSYDIIIAANVFHATRELHETVQHARSLLRPGGYLVMMEVTGPQILRTQFIMGGLPGWWYGVDDGRVFSPAISVPEWDDLLERSGFSGVDHVLHDMCDETKHSFSLIVSQAVNDQVQMLRDPLTSIGRIPADERSILIIGGKTLPVARAIRDIQKCLVPWGIRVSVAKSIDCVESESLPAMTSIICMQELDQPLFLQGFEASQLKSLQDLFICAKHLLWVSHGRMGENPHACMTLGIGRALPTEMPNVALQFLDIDLVKSPLTNVQTILEVFLQLLVSSQPADGDQRLLWTTEPEIFYDNGQRFIPRVLPSTMMNNTYNAARRLITKSVSTEETCVELVASDDDLRLLETGMDIHGDPPTGNVRLRVLYSLRLASDSEKPYYICCGHVLNTGHAALGLSASNASVVDVPEAMAVDLKSTDECFPALLQAVADNLLARSILTLAGPDPQVLVYEPDEGVAAILSREANIVFASSRQEGIPQDWIALHPRLSEREVQRRLPSDMGRFVHFSDALSPRLRASLPSDCPVLQCTVSHVNPQQLKAAFHAALSYFPPCRTPETIRVQDVSLQRPIAAANFAVTDWTDTTDLEIPLRPLDTTSLLSRDHTYLLAGMTGQLGLSLCRWMVHNGARHIALTSRTPNVSHTWIANMRELGANIQIFKADITDRAAVQSLIQDIESSMPPILGVCNACMVLSDKLFLDMDIQTLNNTLKPKVDGSRYLDEVFQNRHLDFFVMFSSLASVIGNAGQSNYHAANLFMAGLAAQRRSRGLAASVMHIGLVADVGYVARQGQAMEERLRKLYFLPLSESDIHHSFAEAILAGKPDSGRQPEIIIGLQDFEDRPDNHTRPPWQHNARFSHFVTRPSLREKKASADLGTVSIKQALAEVDSNEVAMQLVQQAFSRKLEVMMQLQPNSVNINVPLIDLGCDSLLAIEIRGWFLKELGMDVPVLKVLSGDTVAQLCEEATKNYLAVKYSEAPGKGAQEPDGFQRPMVNGCIPRRPSAHSGRSAENDLAEIKNGHAVSHTSSDSPLMESAESSMVTSIDGRDTPNSIPPAPCPGDFSVDSMEASEDIKVDHSGRASFAQSRLWFLMKYLEDPTTYNVTVSYELTGDLKISRLRRAVATTVRQHDCLRSCFFEQPETGLLMQGVMSSPSYLFNDITSNDTMVVKHEYDRMKHRIWDLSRGDLFGVTIVSQSAHRHVVIFGYHHIIMDGMSWHIFLRDLDAAYQMRPLASSGEKYIDFSREQNLAAENFKFSAELEFWRQEHRSLPAVMPLLPLAHVTTRDALQTYESHVVSREVDRELVMNIKRASQKLRVTPFHFHLAVIQVIFSRLLDLEDLCLGIADANRTDDRYAETVGIFLNLLPVRFRLQKDQSFGDLAKATSQKMFAALSNSKVPFDLVLDALKVPRSADHTPLFQVAVNYRMGALLQRPLGDCMLNIASADDAKNPYDISFGITETTFGSSLLELTTQKCLYSGEASELLMDMYVNLLMGFSADDSIRIGDVPLVNKTQLDRAVAQGRGRRVEFGWPANLYTRFDEMVITYASEIAIRDGTTALTYFELASKINSIVTLLLTNNLGPGSKVAVLCQPSSDAIAAMLAVLRIGCVYLPLDTSLPRARHLSMIDDSTPVALLFHHDTRDLALDIQFSCRVTPALIDLSSPTPNGEQSQMSLQPTTSAFLLYTSGSTGAPKGILLSQASFVNHLAAKTELLSIGREVVLQQSSLGFDMSIIQTFCALGNGGTLVIAPKEARGDPVELSKVMSKEKVTFTIATPSEYLMMLRYGFEHLSGLSSWRQACTGGEAVTEELVRAFQSLPRSSMRLTNCYGPTEITAAATFQNVSLDPEVTGEQDCARLVGKALPNYSVYIVDENGQPQPLGVNGEICIGGSGVATGYLNLPEHTASKFVQDPHASPEDIAKGWSMMYRTGDKGCLLDDGTLVFMGRLDGDNQVKVNGIRIELDEVANVLLRTGRGLISDVVVTVRGEPAFLVAHAVLASGTEVSASTLRQLIADLPLPKYMHPSMIVPLERLPINSNGKVDRKAIATLPLPQQQTRPVPAKRLTLREGELRLLWEQILPASGDSSRLEPESDFFMHGGNSMLLVQLQGAIKEAFSVNVPITELYQASTLRRMATCIISKRDQQPKSDEQVDWASETAVSRSIITMAQPDREAPDILHRCREVLLTGSTSFLGSAILASLIEDPNVEKVHCIAISAQDQTRLPSSNKVIAYTGSLLTPNLGLSNADCAKLKSTIHVIIHAGAHGHCLNYYSSLRVPNVHSTSFLVSLALPRSIPIHFLSSNRVTLLSGELDMPPSSVSSYLPRTDGSEGFTSSKWVSEVFLENVCRKTGLKVCVHRACAVTGDRAPNEDALNALLKYTRLLRCVPRFENFQGYLDFKDVHEVAAGIANEALQSVEPCLTPRFVHHSSGEKVPMHEFRKHMEDMDGCCYEEVSVGEWIDRATEAGIDPLITGYLESMTQKGEIIRFPYMGKTAQRG